MRTLRKGSRVTLKANKREGWRRERGTVVSVNRRKDVIMVVVDVKHRAMDDDGLREVTFDQIDLTELLTRRD